MFRCSGRQHLFVVLMLMGGFVNAWKRNTGDDDDDSTASTRSHGHSAGISDPRRFSKPIHSVKLDEQHGFEVQRELSQCKFMKAKALRLETQVARLHAAMHNRTKELAFSRAESVRMQEDFDVQLQEKEGAYLASVDRFTRYQEQHGTSEQQRGTPEKQQQQQQHVQEQGLAQSGPGLEAHGVGGRQAPKADQEAVGPCLESGNHVEEKAGLVLEMYEMKLRYSSRLEELTAVLAQRSELESKALATVLSEEAVAKEPAGVGGNGEAGAEKRQPSRLDQSCDDEISTLVQQYEERLEGKETAWSQSHEDLRAQLKVLAAALDRSNKEKVLELGQRQTRRQQ
mmetsp:Transcript_40192/g.74231  ORF Transcript_40192/g.74231 Transcript_40192/m.74231 type:complete len:341 (-) Transcript_40192:196-1218(-)